MIPTLWYCVWPCCASFEPRFFNLLRALHLLDSSPSPRLFRISIFVIINNSASYQFPSTNSQFNIIKMSGKGYSYKSSGTNSDVSIAIA
jgi:hypothetical protein